MKIRLNQKKKLQFSERHTASEKPWNLGREVFSLCSEDWGLGASWMAAWVGAGGQEDQHGDWRVGTFNPLSPQLAGQGKGQGLEQNLSSVANDLINHAQASIETQRDWVQRPSRLVSIWRCCEGGSLESMDAPHPFPTHLSLRVSSIRRFPSCAFYNKLMIQQEAAFKVLESYSQQTMETRRAQGTSNLYPWDNLDSQVGV